MRGAAAAPSPAPAASATAAQGGKEPHGRRSIVRVEKRSALSKGRRRVSALHAKRRPLHEEGAGGARGTVHERRGASGTAGPPELLGRRVKERPPLLIAQAVGSPQPCASERAAVRVNTGASRGSESGGRSFENSPPEGWYGRRYTWV